MRERQYKTDPSILLEQGKEIVSQSADNKFVHRVSMVNLILGGMTPEELSLYCGDSRRVLYDWLTKVDEQGWESLKAIKQQGRTSKLSESQTLEIKAAVEDDPAKYGYHVWNGPSLSAYIKNKYNVDLGVRSCQKLLHKMGFSLIRPQTYPSLENPDQTVSSLCPFQPQLRGMCFHSFDNNFRHFLHIHAKHLTAFHNGGSVAFGGESFILELFHKAFDFKICNSMRPHPGTCLNNTGEFIHGKQTFSISVSGFISEQIS